MPQLATFPVRRDAIAGIRIAELAGRFGTPLFVYDASVIRARIDALRAFDVIRYAQKANSNIAVLELCRAEGTLVDAVSAGECVRALRAGFAAGGDPPGIVYTADIFDRASLDVVAAHGFHVNCGSPDMLTQYAERLAQSPHAARSDAWRKVTLRINPGFGHGHSKKVNTGGEQSKHGIWHDDLEDCVARAHAHGLTIRCVHVHIGSGADTHHLAKVAQAACDFARRVGPEVESVSAGGGLSVPYRDGDAHVDTAAYFEIWNSARNALAADLGHAIRLEIEPGRYLVAESGYLISEIRATKRMGANVFYLVDAGFNDLARPVMYGAYHPISIAHDGAERATRDVVVAGPLCESGDIFTQGEGGIVETRRLPEAHIGEFLTIENAGAYAFAMSSNYNSKPFAAEVVIDAGQAKLVRARQSLDELREL